MNAAKLIRPAPLRDLRGPREVHNAELLANKVREVWASANRPQMHLDIPVTKSWIGRAR